MDKIVTIMKGKMLILLAVICSFTACVKEELIGPSEGGDIVITAALSTDIIQSKATIPGNADEKTMSTGVVLVFEGASGNGKCIGTGVAEKKEDKMKASVKTKRGTVRIVAIANAEDELQTKLKSAQTNNWTYDNLKSEITKQQLAPASNLIKVGELLTTLSNKTSNNPSIDITLFQLSARIDFSMKSISNSWTFKMLNYTVNSICTSSDLLLADGATNSKETTTGSLENEILNDKFSFYTYQKRTVGNNVILKITGTLTNTATNKSEQKTYTVNLNPTVKDNKTDGFVHGWAYQVDGNINVQSSTLIVNVTAKKWQDHKVDVGYGDSDE